MPKSPAQRGATQRALQAKGVVAVIALLGLAYLSYASYTRAFADEIRVEVHSDRAGLLLEPGADIALRNVTIGRVTSVKDGSAGAVIELAISREHADLVHPPSGANIVSPSLLGPKYVELGVPNAGEPAGARDGDVIVASEVQVEANAAFEDLVAVLDGVQPAQLNTGLGAVATTLDNRGRQLGGYLEQANAYFTRFNESLPAMERDLDAAADVSRIYADIAPQLLAILDAATTTGNTVASRTKALESLLRSLEQTSNTTRTFLATNRVPLRQAMNLLRPTTTTLARYAPMFPCLFESLNTYRKDVEPASGGKYPGLWVHLTVLPGIDGYDKNKDLPKVRADSPTCSGGPIGRTGHYRPPGYDDGSPPLDNSDGPITTQEAPLSIQLFGTDTGLTSHHPTGQTP